MAESERPGSDLWQAARLLADDLEKALGGPVQSEAVRVLHAALARGFDLAQTATREQHRQLNERIAALETSERRRAREGRHHSELVAYAIRTLRALAKLANRTADRLEDGEVADDVTHSIVPPPPTRIRDTGEHPAAHDDDKRG